MTTGQGPQGPRISGNQPPQDGICLVGEKGRTPEFKRVRGEFVTQVNDWLEAVAAARDAVPSLPMAVETNTALGKIYLPFQTTQRRTRTALGRSGFFAAIGENTIPGLWLGGDGKNTPYTLEAFFADPGGNQRFVRVVGSDPVALIASGGEYAPGSGDTRAAVLVETDVNGLTKTHEFTVTGDGSLQTRECGLDGATTSNSSGAAYAAQAGIELFTEQVVGWLKPE
ncbi:MAG: hypothetical protein WAQ24_04665 [Candidatus Saccharimonadales bacterium]